MPAERHNPSGLSWVFHGPPPDGPHPTPSSAVSDCVVPQTRFRPELLRTRQCWTLDFKIVCTIEPWNANWTAAVEGEMTKVNRINSIECEWSEHHSKSDKLVQVYEEALWPKRQFYLDISSLVNKSKLEASLCWSTSEWDIFQIIR